MNITKEGLSLLNTGDLLTYQESIMKMSERIENFLKSSEIKKDTLSFMQNKASLDMNKKVAMLIEEILKEREQEIGYSNSDKEIEEEETEYAL